MRGLVDAVFSNLLQDFVRALLEDVEDRGCDLFRRNRALSGQASFGFVHGGADEGVDKFFGASFHCFLGHVLSCGEVFSEFREVGLHLCEFGFFEATKFRLERLVFTADIATIVVAPLASPGQQRVQA